MAVLSANKTPFLSGEKMCNVAKNKCDLATFDDEERDLQVLNSLKEFGYSITHEMRTPLSTISILCRLINIELSKDNFNKEKLLSHTEKINSEVKHIFNIADIIDDRLCDSEYPGAFVELNIKDVVDSAIGECNDQNTGNDSIQFDCKSDFLFLGDKGSIMHVLHNLLRNAVYNMRYIKNEGRIVITADELEDCNLLSFKNQFSENERRMCDSMFDPVMPKKFCGTNLGLYFCKNIMSAMDVELCCKSKDDQCIEFIFKFQKI